ncbi:hypothetical protein HOY82DRAFT_603190 [Tuber indicum]|nr:hypothetical protein HOY82DRAFT_603190 [Tuber indicum]
MGIVLTGEDFSKLNPTNSEVSQQFLDVALASQGAVAYIQRTLILLLDRATLYHLISYSESVDRFTLADLKSKALGDVEETAFCTLLLYCGAFTFDKDHSSKFLSIPNHIIAKRFGTSILRRFALLGSMQNAASFLSLDSNIINCLKGYQEPMAACDINHGGYLMTEHEHRNNFYIANLENPGLNPQVEYQVTNSSRGSGLVDLVITYPDYSIAVALSKLGVDEILKLKFHQLEKYRKGTLQRWIKNEVTAQLKSYVYSPGIRELAQNRRLHDHPVLVVGSRKIFVVEMSMKENWIYQPVLAEKM